MKREDLPEEKYEASKQEAPDAVEKGSVRGKHSRISLIGLMPNQSVI